MTLNIASTIQDRIGVAVSRLMSHERRNDRVLLSVPVSYPSGALATVDVTFNGDRCFVTDQAMGLSEAEMYGAGDFYDASAKRAADRFGIGYDGASIFALWAPIDRLEGAIVAVSNASAHAAATAVLKAAEEKERATNHELYERVASIFGKHIVAKTFDIVGRNNTWSAHNVVTLDRGRLAVFEFVTNHSNSLSNKFMMFSDIVKVERPVSLNSVVKKIDSLGPKGNMLADVSNIVELSSPDQTFIEYAEAA